MNSTETNDYPSTLNGPDLVDVNSAGSSQNNSLKSGKAARQIKAVTGPLFKQLYLLRNLKKDLRQGLVRRNEETSGLFQGSLRVECTTIGLTNALRARYKIGQTN